MPVVKNLSNRSYTLPTGHVIQVDQSELLSPGVLAHPDNAPIIEGLVRSRRIQLGKAPNPKSTHELTRDALAKSKRADLVELWEAHGLDPEDAKQHNVDTLREILSDVIFVNL